MNTTDVHRVSVLIADDHGMVRRGTRAILEQSDSIEVVGEAADGVEAVELAMKLRPDVALLDVAMPRMTGVEAAREIRELLPNTKVLMLTVHEDVEYVWQAIRVGVSGYVLKDATDAELIGSVLSVAEGNSVLDTSVTRQVLERFRQLSTGPPRKEVSLSPRETEVLQLAARGQSNNQIGANIGLSRRTVEVHLYKAYKKLGVGSRTEAVVTALQRGLITVDGGP